MFGAIKIRRILGAEKQSFSCTENQSLQKPMVFDAPKNRRFFEGFSSVKERFYKSIKDCIF